MHSTDPQTNTWLPSLCSVTFRSLNPTQIIELCERNNIRAIEWGSDVHLPPGEIRAALRLREQMTNAGLTMGSYGSYIFAGSDRGWLKQPPQNLNEVLDTAMALGAPAIRIWAGAVASQPSTQAQRQTTYEALEHICQRAEQNGLAITLEYHPGTLTDEVQAANELFDQVSARNLFSHWQPRPGLSKHDAFTELQQLRLPLSYLHVSHWRSDGSRLPLSDGVDFWKTVFTQARSKLAPHWPGARFACLEFIRGDDAEQFQRDAQTLHTQLL